MWPQGAQQQHKRKKKMNIMHIIAIVVIALLATVACAWLGELVRAQKHIGKSNRARAATRAILAWSLITIGFVLAPLHKLRELWKYGGNAKEFVNIAEGVHGDGNITKLASAAMATRFLIVKFGADADHITISTAATDVLLGVCTDEATAAEDPVNVALIGSATGTLRVALGGTVAAGDLLTSDGAGKAVTASSTNKIVGRALGAGVDGEVIEFAVAGAGAVAP
jgi:hypothetical protein